MKDKTFVILIEKERYPRDKLCGGAIFTMGQHTLKKLDIQIDIPHVPINNAIYRYCDEEYHHKSPNFLKIVRRIEFDHFLAKKAIDRGLILNQNETFLEYTKSNDGIVVTTDKSKYNVNVLVGADGALSKVRKSMNLSAKLRFATGIEIFAPVNSRYDDEFDANAVTMDFTFASQNLQGYIWHFPCLKDGKPYMNHGICNARINEHKRSINLKDFFTRELKSRDINVPPSSWQGHPVPWNGDFSEMSKSNVILVGDAAGIEPLIGGGIHLSLLYGELAAKTIIDAFKNNDFSFDNYSDNFMNHITGRYIMRSIFLAREIYSDRLDVIETIKRILNK